MEEMHATADLAPAILKADKVAMRALKRHRRDYFRTLHESIGPLAASQMSGAANAVASFWRTAWEQAGSPQLSHEE